ncbi:unnamed protein product [Durusdinium trenchii]|uniref:Uncharacterized protein n=2 Tax=Durusdinium trenchii TaxID=1381693 RepID=A0ABP0LXV6_9DINO
MPSRLFFRLVCPSVYRLAAYSSIPLFFLSAWTEQKYCAGRQLVRCLTAVSVTLFQLGDSCRTSSHRDYLMLYICWAWVLVPEKAQAVASGLCVLYILGSGLSKLRVGGTAWPAPATLRAILRTFAQKTPRQGGPILLFANRWVCHSDLLCGFLASTTLLFECLLAPLGAFLLPSHWRLPSVGLAMVLLHLGIGAVQSGAIGAFFLPNVAAYVLGFGTFTSGEDLSILAPSWWIALVTCFLPLCLAAARETSLIQEDWPWTPFALFPWNSDQWEFLHQHLVEGDTRLVALAGEASLPGARVIPIEHRSDVPLLQRRVEPNEGEVVCYDLWSRTIGITTYQDEVMLALLDLHQGELLKAEKSQEKLKQILQLTAKFLETGRVLEVSTGQPLMRCFLVRVTRGLRVQEVLMEGCG